MSEVKKALEGVARITVVPPVVLTMMTVFAIAATCGGVIQLWRRALRSKRT